MEKRCILCGRKFIVEDLAETVREEEEDIFEPPRKIPSLCPLCQAKVKHEAEESQKVPKPM